MDEMVNKGWRIDTLHNDRGISVTIWQKGGGPFFAEAPLNQKGGAILLTVEKVWKGGDTNAQKRREWTA